ncbi:MAG: hypothetical protein WAW63_05960 [Candidatus Saccharimonadales bacterium]|nr:hypothetical protein [Candidatus Saccharibacteria bacterium]
MKKDINACKRRANNATSGNAFYSLGMLGALVFYVQQADGFWPIILAVLKAIVWPVFFVYDVLVLVS